MMNLQTCYSLWKCKKGKKNWSKDSFTDILYDHREQKFISFQKHHKLIYVKKKKISECTCLCNLAKFYTNLEPYEPYEIP